MVEILPGNIAKNRKQTADYDKWRELELPDFGNYQILPSLTVCSLRGVGRCSEQC